MCPVQPFEMPNRGRDCASPGEKCRTTFRVASAGVRRVCGGHVTLSILRQTFKTAPDSFCASCARTPYTGEALVRLEAAGTGPASNPATSGGPRAQGWLSNATRSPSS